MGVAQAGTPTSPSSRSGTARLAEPQKPKLLDRLREALRSRHYSPRTEQSYHQWLMAGLMYGAGLRLMECLRLRVQDIDFERREIMVRDGKGAKDRRTMLPESLTTPLREHLRAVQAIHDQDLADGWGRVQMPEALDRKYLNAPADWRWQWKPVTTFARYRSYWGIRTCERP